MQFNFRISSVDQLHTLQCRGRRKLKKRASSRKISGEPPDMGDDFAALELDTDQDEEMVALFGRSPEPPICSTERNKLTTMGTKSVRTQNAGLNLPSTVNQSCESSKPQTQSLLCITNKRPAAALNQSWPHKARHPTPSANVADPNVSFDDLELDSWEPGGIHTHQASSGTGRQNNNSLSSVAAMALSSQAAGIGGHLQARSNTDSQATEVWQSAYSRPLQTSQASMPVRRASTSQHISYSQQAASAHAAPRHRMTPRGPDISTAMVGICCSQCSKIMLRSCAHQEADRCRSVSQHDYSCYLCSVLFWATRNATA